MFASSFGGDSALRNYFDLFVESCGNNPTIDFLFFTDSSFASKYSNFRVIHTSLEKIKADIVEFYKGEVDVSLTCGIKTTDFFPAFGEIYRDLFSGYDFWGYLDNDIILGDLRSFLTEDILQKYDKISPTSHFSLLRNTPRLNSLYRTKIGNKEPWKEAFRAKGTMAFAERPITDFGMNRICSEKHVEIYDSPVFYDVSCLHYRLQNSFYLFPKKEKENKRHCVFAYQHGELFKVLLNKKKGQFAYFGLAYIHLQKRPMKYNGETLETPLLIKQGSFENIDVITNDIVWRGNKNRLFSSKYTRKHFLRNVIKFVLMAVPGLFEKISWHIAKK